MEKLIFNGVVPNTEVDERDYTVAMFVPNIDENNLDAEFMMDMPQVEMILNQGSIGSCVAHSIVTAAKILNWQLTNKIIDFSPMALYGTRYSGHHTGVGMVPDQALYVAVKEGLFYKRDFDEQLEVPDIISAVSRFKNYNPNKVSEAKKFQLSGYARISTYGSYEVFVKNALKNRMPVIGCWPIYSSFYNIGSDGKVPKPVTYKERSYGYHEMCIVGWTKDNYWVVINSWGIENGMKGVYLIPFKFTPNSLFSLSDTICPCKCKAKKIRMNIGSNVIEVDGSNKTIDVAPYISKESRTMVPVRFVTEYLGASVEWLETTQQVIVRSEEHIIELKIGHNDYLIDGKVHYMDTCPQILNDRTFLPIRFVSEALGCDISYAQEDDKQIVEILSL